MKARLLGEGLLFILRPFLTRLWYVRDSDLHDNRRIHHKRRVKGRCLRGRPLSGNLNTFDALECCHAQSGTAVMSGNGRARRRTREMERKMRGRGM